MAVRRLYEGFLPGRHAIEAYGAGGFRFGDISHRGSILALPSGIHLWPVETLDAMTEASLAPLFAEADEIDLVLLGTGEDMAAVPEAMRWPFRDAHMGLEPMATAAAARTYNILLGEGRRVAAALIAVT
jgi:uncharacterized protein